MTGSLSSLIPDAKVKLIANTGVYRSSWPVAVQQLKILIIVPARSEARLTRRCIKSIYERTQYSNFEVVLVDNGSDAAEMLHYLNELCCEGTVRLIHDPRPFSYLSTNNNASKFYDGDILLFLNNDTEVKYVNWLEEMVSHVLRPEVG